MNALAQEQVVDALKQRQHELVHETRATIVPRRPDEGVLSRPSYSLSCCSWREFPARQIGAVFPRVWGRLISRIETSCTRGSAELIE